MADNIATTVMLTTKCSGGCTHCPFSNLRMEKLFLSPELAGNIFIHSDEQLVVLSGGEPFEHPEISAILMLAYEQTSKFRIATGGFVDLSPWIDKLRHLSRFYGSLQGVSVGTDVLSTRVSSSRWVENWKANIHLLSKFEIPYSLTITVGPDLDFKWFNIWQWTAFFEGKPSFIYLRHLNNHTPSDWMEKIYKTFGEIPVISDDFSDGK